MSEKCRLLCRSGRQPSRILHSILILLTLLAIVAVTIAGSADSVMMSSIRLLSAAQDTESPVANAGEDFSTYAWAETVFNGTASSDNVGISAYTWTFDDGGPRTLAEAEPVYVFQVPGSYTVTLNVTDLEGNWDTDSVTITVIEDPTPPDIRVVFYTTVYVGETATFNASRSFDVQTGVANVSWNFTYDGEEVTEYGTVLEWEFGAEGDYVISLTVTNRAGMSNTTTLSLAVQQKPTWIEEHWLGLSVSVAIFAVACLYLFLKYRKDNALMTPAERERAALRVKDAKKLWKTFRKNKLGFAGFFVLVMFGLMAMLAPVLATVPNPNYYRNYEETRPGWDNPVEPTFDRSPFTGFTHPLGTDYIGRDIYSMLLYGARASLMVGFVATAISIAVGVAVGLISGYYGKYADELLMRVTDYFLVLPWFPLVIVIMTVLGPKFEFVIITIGVTSWPSTARIVRAQVLTVKERSFIERSKAIGASDLHIIRKHVFPNVLPLVFANTVLLISTAIFTEAFLDFFGLGDPTVISWGIMLEAAYENGAFDSGAWWWTVPPSLAIIICVLSFSLVGYALDDIFNPRLRKR